MSPITRAIASGFNANQILNFLSHAIPSLKGRIKQALVTGYTAKEILNILSQGMGGEPVDTMSEAEIHQKRNQSRNETVKSLLKAAGATGLGALGRMAAMPAALAQNPQNPPALPQSLPQSPTVPGSPGSPNIGPAPMSNAPVQPTPVGSSSPTAAAGAVPATSSTPAALSSKQQAEEVIRGLGAEERVKELAKMGKTPKDIASSLEMEMHPATRKAHFERRGRGEQKPLAEYVQEYLTTPDGLLREDVIKFGQPEKPMQDSQSASLNQAKLVATPHGMGTVEHERNGQVLVNVDGKKHVADASKLIESPLPEKELGALYADVLRGVEKETGEEVSRNVNWAGYDPKTNTLAYLPHLGGLYTYENIDEEEAKLLTSILNTRKTSGENFIGAWKEGSKSPIGSAMSKIIQKLQSNAGGKGKEYSHKFETLYNALEPAMRAAKKKKDEEKRRKREKR